MGQLVGNLGIKPVYAFPGGGTVTVHQHSQKVPGMVGCSIHYHHGANNLDVELPVSADVGSVFDVVNYARDPGHTTRDGTFDTKMTAIWGGAYSNLPGYARDDIFAGLRTGHFVPPA
jgi:hypothetical protein